MACFLVPTAEAIVTTVAANILQRKQKEKEVSAVLNETSVFEQKGKLPFFRKLRWLSNLLWGGSALLAFEHVWHGEVTPWFPFLTAASNPGDAAEMLYEMSTIGVTMAVLVTAIWGGMLAVSRIVEKRKPGCQPTIS
jgi:hypothetical protein